MIGYMQFMYYTNSLMYVCVTDNDTVEVVYMAMNNMASYLPNNVIKQDMDM